ncbi:lysophospholipid acyltransferase family protein [Craterilacuibacter sp.]|uniref:lysophospholipid acyltransferase family protein n=1 Tax=Craterilacuibacter sp. TaxID=2870909 RepID=UPI003F335200
MSRLAQILLAALARLPLGWLQAIGALLGRITYHTSPQYAARIEENLKKSGVCANYQVYQEYVKKSVAETGKGTLELALAWTRDSADICALIKSCDGWEHVETALAAGQGIIFVTPHLGAYDIAGRYIASRLPFSLTAMYRPPKLAWLEPVMQGGRMRDNVKTAPATPAGVRLVMKALKNGEATIILPDQVPGSGDGVWAPFFGRPAYTMTLLPRLAQMNNVATLLFYGERLPAGQGFAVHISPLPAPFSGDKAQDGMLMNQAIEQLIRRCPTQYLWSYNRYKTPAGASGPHTETPAP